MRRKCWNFLFVSLLLGLPLVAQDKQPSEGVPNALFFNRDVALPPEAGSQVAQNVIFMKSQDGAMAQSLETGAGNLLYSAVANTDKPVKGAPYSATAVNETVQVLADGNRIVHKNSTVLARDGMGRTRREESGLSLGGLPVEAAKVVVLINDPVAKADIVLEPGRQIARVNKQVNSQLFIVNTPEGAAQRLTNDIKARATEPAAGVRKERVVTFNAEDRVITFKSVEELETADGSKTESLGVQTIEGVPAEGKRTTRTIPAGEVGNERPIEIVSEWWYSPELQVTVLSKRSDPRSGETTYRLTDIRRGEPDHSLFEVPSNYKVEEGPVLPVVQTPWVRKETK